MRSFNQFFLLKNKEIKIIAIYAITFLASLIIVKLFFKEDLFEASNFLYWDAEHYNYIQKFRYEDYRVAFFPLLPLVWKYLSLNVYGIVAFNSITFLVCFWILIREFKFSHKEILICLTIPSLIFFYLPFSESLFFLGSTIILIGLKNRKLYLLLTGLFLSSLTRPAFLIFIPALILTEIFAPEQKIPYQRRIGFLMMALLTMALGTLLVAYIQYLDTGEWFKFLGVQKGWGNHLQIPKLPLTSWAGGYIVRLDGSAFFVGSAAGIFTLLWLIKVKFLSKIEMPKEVFFSLAYIGGITLSVLIFRGGSLFSLNRFVFATAFMVIAFHFFYNSLPAFNSRQLFFIFLGIMIFFIILFQSWSHIQTFLKFLFLSFYVFLPFTLKSKVKWVSQAGFMLLLLLNIFFLLSLYLRFLDGGWIA